MITSLADDLGPYGPLAIKIMQRIFAEARLGSNKVIDPDHACEIIVQEITAHVSSKNV